jgi:hypothetical protein
MKHENEISKSAIVEAIFKKMSWLGEHFNKREINKVSFKSFTHTLLAQDCEFHPFEQGYEDLMGSCDSTPARLGKKILLFSKDGKLIGQVGVRTKTIPKKSLTCRKFFFFGPVHTTIVPAYEEKELFLETVGESLERLDQKNETYYIVGLIGYDLIITKPSCGTNIQDSLVKELYDAETFILKQLS